MFYNAVVVLARFLISILYRFKVTGKENIPDGAAVVCGNHTSEHDPVFVIGAFGFKHRLYPMSKVENKSRFIISWVLTKIDVIFVARGKSDIAAIKKSMQLLKNNQKLLIFPEGTRVKEGQTVEAKRGGVMLAARNNVPIIPVFITTGTKHPFSSVKVVIGKPYRIEVQGKPSGDFLDSEAAALMHRIALLGEENANG